MTGEEREELLKHLKYNRSIGADYSITDKDADEIIKALEQEPCEDAVSRQAVDELSKELVHTTRDKADFLCNFWEGLSKLPPVNPQSNTGSRWIPVSERLPEEETDVLICNRNGDIEISSGSYSTEVENDFIWYTSGWRFGKVIAWMPSPAPFKPQESEG